MHCSTLCLGCVDYRCYPTLATIGATRLHIPSPMVLYHRVKAVFDLFIDKKDTLTGKPLFHAEAKKAAQRVLAAIRRGEFSYPPGVDFYVRKTDRYGREMVDSDGLWLYRSIRGTSNLESLHQKLTKKALADEEQLDEDISILEDRPDSPRPRIFVKSRRGRRRVVPAAAPPARRGRTCQVADCSNPAACPGRSNRESRLNLPVAERT
jgi:hypothetical protein